MVFSVVDLMSISYAVASINNDIAKVADDLYLTMETDGNSAIVWFGAFEAWNSEEGEFADDIESVIRSSVMDHIAIMSRIRL
jgi:hypothetical protein